jgi:hypothetical protein
MLYKCVRCTTNVGDRYAAIKIYDVPQAILVAEVQVCLCSSKAPPAETTLFAGQGVEVVPDLQRLTQTR